MANIIRRIVKEVLVVPLHVVQGVSDGVGEHIEAGKDAAGKVKSKL